jgi:hypothetical protein
MKGGARHYFRLPAHITDVETLARNVGFVSVSAHGNLTGNVFVVPDNTYIMFLGGAGHPIERRANQIPALKKYRFRQPDETPKQWYERTYNDIHTGAFFKDKLYKPDMPYAHESVSIYEPGDIVQDLSLSFENMSHPFLLLGVWRCPIPADLGTEFDRINNGMQLQKDAILQAREEYKAIDKQVKELGGRVDDDLQIRLAVAGSIVTAAEAKYMELEPDGKALQDSFPGHPNNYAYSSMILDKMSESSLFEIVHKLNNTRLSEKPIRFLVVEACRSIPEFHPALTPFVFGVEVNETNKNLLKAHKGHEQLARRRRRFSLMARDPLPAVATINPSFRYTMDSLNTINVKVQEMLAATPSSELSEIHKLSELSEIIKAVVKRLPHGNVKINHIEHIFTRFANRLSNLISANVRNIKSRLQPYKRFDAGEYVLIKDTDKKGIVIGWEDHDGYVMFKVQTFDDDGNIQTEIIDPYALMKETDTEKQGEIDGIFMSMGIDVGALIAKEQADKLLEHQTAKEHIMWSENVLTRWRALDESKRFNPGDRVLIGKTSNDNPETVTVDGTQITLTGKHGIVKNIEVLPPTHSKYPDMFFYKLGINGISKNIPRRPDVLTLAGGRRTTRRGKTHRRKQTRRRK